MKRMSKFAGLRTGRNLRSSKNIKTEECTVKTEESSEDEEVTSKYFVAEIVEPAKVKEENADEPKEEKVKSPKKEQAKKRQPIKIKYEEAKSEEIEKKEIESSGSDEGKWMPPNWEKTLSYIREMRKYGTAPVDTMGCDTCADPQASAPVSRYQTLISLMLSSQTKDQVTHAAVERLKKHGCTPQNILETSNDELGKIIYPVGFWKRKVEYIKKTSEILVRDYNGDIPRTLKELCALPGVGPKMAHLCMQVAWDEISGIGVDTHVHRISNRLGWVKKETKNPEGTRTELESWLPKDLWREVNHLLVGFGQEICLPRFPNCKDCLNRSICPWAKNNGKF